MNEYNVKMQGRSNNLRWFGDSVKQVKKETEAAGHRVVNIRFVREIKAKKEINQAR